jgi:hypothetical protein
LILSEEEEEYLSTEEKLDIAFDLYEVDCEKWESEIFLGELERLYSYRARLNKMIAMMITQITSDLKR